MFCCVGYYSSVFFWKKIWNHPWNGSRIFLVWLRIWKNRYEPAVEWSHEGGSLVGWQRGSPWFIFVLSSRLLGGRWPSEMILILLQGWFQGLPIMGPPSGKLPHTIPILQTNSYGRSLEFCWFLHLQFETLPPIFATENPPRLLGFKKNLGAFNIPKALKEMMGFVKRFVSPTCFFVAGIFPETNMAPWT